MQTPPQAADVSPALPQTPRPPVSITVVGPDGKTQTLTVPRTEAEVHELQMQRDVLSEQLTNVSARRRIIAEEIRETRDPALRTGLEDRLRLLDQRILQMETDLATTGRQISSAPADLSGATGMVYSSGGGGHFEEGLMVGGFSVLFFMSAVLFFARRRWKRRGTALPSGLGVESQRLERLENGMEAIAIEIERVSEGQRFVTRLLSESQSPLAASQRIGQPAGAEHNDPLKG